MRAEIPPLLVARERVELADGRSLSYSAAGPPDGFPLIYMHGAIGSPPNRSPALEGALRGSHIRYLMVDRPGFGASDPQPRRRVADFAADVEQLADALRLGCFSVVGISAGASYALACAWAMPDRLLAAAAVSAIPPGLAPHRARGAALRFRLPLLVLRGWPAGVGGLADGCLRLLRRHPALLRRLMALGASREDRQALDGPDALEVAARRFLAATAVGPRPMIEDYLVACRGWGFEPREVRGRVHLWHGVQDPVIPIAHVRRLAAELPNCRASFEPEGHFFFGARIREILAPLAPNGVQDRGEGPALPSPPERGLEDPPLDLAA